MASDTGVAITANLVTKLESVSDIGKVFNHQPMWNTPTEMDANGRVIIGGQPQHRFVTIQMATNSEGFTNGSDLALHSYIVEFWLGAGIDTDHGSLTAPILRALIASALAILRPPQSLSSGDAFCGYTEDGLPRETDEMEFRFLLGIRYHVATVELTVREEVAHA